MYLREKKNKSGSTSVQIIQLLRGRYKVVKTVGCAHNEQELQRLIYLGKQEIERQRQQPGLFHHEEEMNVDELVSNVDNARVDAYGPEIIFGSIFDCMLPDDDIDPLLSAMVLTRIIHPGPKLYTLAYLKESQSLERQWSEIYHFLDNWEKSDQHLMETQLAEYLSTRNYNCATNSICYVLPLEMEEADDKLLHKYGITRLSRPRKRKQFIQLETTAEGMILAVHPITLGILKGKHLLNHLRRRSKSHDKLSMLIVLDGELISKANKERLTASQQPYVLLGDKVNDKTKSSNTTYNATELKQLHQLSNRLQLYFRIPLHDLQVKTVGRQLRKRIEAHLAITQMAWNIGKDLEKTLHDEGLKISLHKAIEISKSLYRITYTALRSGLTRSKLLQMNDEQNELFRVITRHY